MGTNYYLRARNKVLELDVCECCGKGTEVMLVMPDDIHIGKRSHGWKFVFHGYKWFDATKYGLNTSTTLDSYEQWLRFLVVSQNVFIIVDEYGAVLDLSEMLSITLHDFNGKTSQLPSTVDQLGFNFIYSEFL